MANYKRNTRRKKRTYKSSLKPLKAGQTRIKRAKKVAVKIIAAKGGRKDNSIVQTKKFRYRDSKGNWRLKSIQTITKVKKYGKKQPKI